MAGSRFVMVDAQIREEGLDKVLEEAGFAIRQPGCSACLAMNDDKVPAGKYAVSTSNRNFEGRQGPGARTLLASPLVAAAAAVTGGDYRPEGVYLNQGSLQREKLRAYVLCSEERTIK